MFAPLRIARSMDDAALPSSWASAGRNALANSLWILPLIATERAFDNHLDKANRERDAANAEADKNRRERDSKISSVEEERDAAKADLETSRQELAAAKAAKAPDTPPPPTGHVDYRRLSPVQTRILIRDLSAAKPDIPRVLFASFQDHAGESPQYMRDFLEAFRRAGITAVDNGQQDISEPGQEGIFLCVPDVKSPPVVAVRIAKAFEAASLEYKFAPLQRGRQEFTVFIGPNPL
jgi:hypothetical protein